MTGKDAERLLDLAGITCNKNTIPYDTQKPFVTSGIRLGAAAMTTRGFKEKEFEKVTDLMIQVLKSKDEEFAKKIREEVIKTYSGSRIQDGSSQHFDQDHCHWQEQG